MKPHRSAMTFGLMLLPVILVIVGWALAYIPIEFLQFKEDCRAEAGLRQFQPLERNVGWEGSSQGDKGFLLYSPYISFVRAPAPDPANTRSGKMADYTYSPTKRKSSDMSGVLNPYDLTEPDATKTTVYRIVHRFESVPGRRRMNRSVQEVVDIRNNQVVTRETTLTYLTADPDNFALSILGLARFKMCRDREYTPNFDKDIQRNFVFKNIP